MLETASVGTVVVEAAEAVEVIPGVEDVETEILTVAEEDEDLIEEAPAIRDLPLVVETRGIEIHTELHHPESPIHMFLLVVAQDAMTAEDLLHLPHAPLHFLDQTRDPVPHHVGGVRRCAVGLLHQTDRTDTEDEEAVVEEEVLIVHTAGGLHLSLDPDPPDPAKAEDPHLHRPVYLLHHDLEDPVVTVARDLDLLQARGVELPEEYSHAAEREERLHQVQHRMKNQQKAMLDGVEVVMIANIG